MGAEVSSPTSKAAAPAVGTAAVPTVVATATAAAAAAAAQAALEARPVLRGTLVSIEALEAHHLPDLKRIAFASPDEFRLTSTPTDEAEAEKYFGTVFAQREAGHAYPVAVLDAAGKVVGTSRLTEIEFKHMRCELGFSWYDPGTFRTGVNVESKLLLLRFAFETLGMHRVQIHTDTRNVRSQKAILALGAKFEGVLRRHQIAKDGYVRDTMVYAITDLDWPEAERHLQGRLARHLERQYPPKV